MTLPPGSRKGFTLLEALISILIVSIIATGVLASLRAGISAYRRLSRTSSEIHETRLALTLMEKELRNMIPYSKAPFAGKASQFTFPAVITKYEEKETNDTPALITYEYRGEALIRREIPLRDLFSGSKESSQKIIPSLKKFIVEYAYRDSKSPEITWRDSWPKELGIPKGLRVTMTLDDSREKKPKKQRQTFTFTKEIHIPQGSWGWREKDLSL